MEIRHIRYFRTIVEAGGLTKAASVLHITPGALSKAMRQLEKQAGKKLFVRVGRNLALTEHGRVLYRTSERLLDEHARLLQSLDASRPTTASTLRIASFEVFYDALSRSAGLGSIRGHRSSAVGNARRRNRGCGGKRHRRLLDHLRSLPFPSPRLHVRRLARVEFGVFVRSGAFKRTSFPELPFAIPVAPLRTAPSGLLRIDSWPYERVPRSVKYRLTSLESALELVRRGRCAVFIPLFIAGLHNQTVRRDLRMVRRRNPVGMKPVHQSVYLVTRGEDRNAPFATKLGAGVSSVIEQGEAALPQVPPTL